MLELGEDCRQKLLKNVTAGILSALASCQPHQYNRSRWTGCDIAIDELGVMEAVHRLLSTSYARFCAAHSSSALVEGRYLSLAKAFAKYEGAPMAQLIDETAAEGGVGQAQCRMAERPLIPRHTHCQLQEPAPTGTTRPLLG